MNCFQCQSKFDQNKYVPKLLIMCGHTLCEKCCQEIFKNGKIQCLQCKTNTYIDKVTSLPKNLALISERNTLIKHCEKHDKKYEAFCSNEKMLICIQCILQDGHKNHEINSIPKAYELSFNSIKGKIEKIQLYLNSIQLKAEQNIQIQNQAYKSYKSTHQVIRQTFQSIRQLIDSQQMTLIKQIEQFFKSCEEKFAQKSQTYALKISEIQNSLYEAQQFQSQSEVDYLDKIKQQEEKLNLIKFISYQNQKNVPYSHTKNSILESCVKILTSEKNNCKISAFSSNNSQVDKIAPKTQKIPVEPIRGFRKAAFSNIHNIQNNKPQKKVSSRKQSITHQVQPPNLKPSDKALKPSNIIRPLSSCQNSSQKKTIKKIDIIECVNSDISSVDPRQSLCNSFMSNMTSFMSEGKSVYILGGFNEDNNNVMRLDLNSMTYHEVTRLNANRSKFGAAFADKKLYVFGGKKGKERLNDIEAYDFQKYAWTKIGTMNKSRSGFGIALLEDQVYLIGGNDGENILSTVESFNLKTKQWKRLCPMIQSRDQLVVTVGNDDRIYAIGGFGGPNNESLRSVECFDTKTKQWKQISKMKYARRALSSAVLADGIYAIGGFDGASYMSSVQKFDYTTNQWAQIASMNVARCTHSSVAVYETQQIYVFGGFDFLPLSSVQKYSLINNEWQQLPEMPSARFMHSSMIVKNNIC